MAKTATTFRTNLLVQAYDQKHSRVSISIPMAAEDHLPLPA
jgi:hypothetical protein